jgi:hypothetical protein
MMLGQLHGFSLRGSHSSNQQRSPIPSLFHSRPFPRVSNSEQQSRELRQPNKPDQNRLMFFLDF